jgi:fused signal recognition particle receptor
VAYDACEAAKARGADVLIVDTAGRLHTQDHLMRELTKIRDVVAKRIDSAPHEVLLILDATTGQNAIRQAQEFGKAINVTGLVLTKLDGTAKGGIVIAIRDALAIPVKFIGLGETPQDIETFDPQRFVNALFTERPA